MPQRTWGKERRKEHPTEHHGPCQEKRVNPGDDNWGLKVNSLPLLDPKVSSDPGDAIASSLVGNYMRPVYSENDSAYIHNSGRKR